MRPKLEYCQKCEKAQVFWAQNFIYAVTCGLVEEKLITDCALIGTFEEDYPCYPHDDFRKNKFPVKVNEKFEIPHDCVYRLEILINHET